MKSSYLDYAMSVIVSRAIPDVRDGLKPVQRRIVYAMQESGNDYNKPYRKSARIVGDVMGKYHPHGDRAIYDALVRMAQPFSMGALLIDGQGNFGSVDNDPAAAMRYTESRMSKIAHHLVTDIDKGTVDYQSNYDGSESEPMVLPAEYPNLLVNGAGGIAVGMATNIPPHNLGEVIDGCLAYIKNTSITGEEMLEIIPAPDFPTGAKILGITGSRSASLTGRGSVIMRSTSHFEKLKSGKEAVIFTEIPYQVNKARVMEKIGELVRDKKIEGISDLRDESDKSGIRIVVECKKDAVADVVQNQLFHLTPLQTSFGVNMLALDKGKPRQLNVLDIVTSFIEFREEVITKRTEFLLGKARDKAHILLGLSIAVANIDEVIALIRSSKDPSEAKQRLMSQDWIAGDIKVFIDLVQDGGNEVIDGRVKFTEAQAKAILEMRLAKLTGLEQEKIGKELEDLAAIIREYLSILQNRDHLIQVLTDELVQIKEEFAVPRRSQIEIGEFEQDIEDLIQQEDMVVSVTARGYIKRVPLVSYKAQRRGGKGRNGVAMRDDEDAAINIFATNTHVPLLFFSNKGMCYRTKVYKLPLGSPTSAGRALVNILPLDEGERITNITPLPQDEADWDNTNIVFATKSGNIRRNSLADFKDIRANGKIAMKLDEGDQLVGVLLAENNDNIMLATAKGQALRCQVEAVRVFKGRNSIGVRGIKFKQKDDYVINLLILHGVETDIESRNQYLKIDSDKRLALKGAINAELETDELLQDISADERGNLNDEQILEFAKAEDFILSITSNGFGKRSSSFEYRVTGRGGSGIVNIITNERNGDVAGCCIIEDNQELIVITDKGKLIRCPVQDIRIAGRNTQGVTVLRTNEEEQVVSISPIDASDEDDEEEEANGNEVSQDKASEDNSEALDTENKE